MFSPVDLTKLPAHPPLPFLELQFVSESPRSSGEHAVLSQVLA